MKNLKKTVTSFVLIFLMIVNLLPVYAIEIALEGEGTLENPYIIADFADYQLLSEAVKGGETFQGKYFLQTDDIVFDPAKPYGTTVIYGIPKDYEFAGVYDGGGCSITVAEDYNNVSGYQGKDLGIVKVEGGLFGTLSGIVKNLVVKGEWRLANDGGVIAHTVIDTGKIINCGVRDFIARPNLDGKQIFGLASTKDYDGVAIYNCFYTKIMVTNTGQSHVITNTETAAKYCYYYLENDPSQVLRNEQQEISADDMASLHTTLNENLEVVAQEAGVDLYGLMMWKKDGSAPNSDKTYFYIPEPVVYDFEGEGTYETPYLIKTIDDYNKLADYVKTGEKFENKYFLQTSDIAFVTAKYGYEIIYGLSESDEFAGIYNGGGHSITMGTDYNHIYGYKGADMGVTKLNQGLFGKLSGVVMNLVLKGYWRNDKTGGVFAHKVVNEGKIINCGTHNFSFYASLAGNPFYGFASTEGYDGIAIYNCYYNSHFASASNTTCWIITNTDAYKDCWYYLGAEPSNSHRVDFTKGTQIDKDALSVLHNNLNDKMFDNALDAGIAPVDLVLWKTSEVAGTPKINNGPDVFPVFDTKTFTKISIDGDDFTLANQAYTFKSLTYFKDANEIVVKLDGETVKEYYVDSIYENSVSVPARLITEGKHTLIVEGLTGGEVKYTASKIIVADAAYVTNVTVSGSLTSGQIISVTADVKNGLTTASDITLLLGVYNKEDALVDYNIVRYSDVVDEISDAEISVTLDEISYENCKAVLYVWNNMLSMKAMLSEIEILE